MSFTLQQSPLLSLLLGDMEIAALFSVEADIAAMLAFESALASAQAEHGFISAMSAAEISDGIKTLHLDRASLEQGVARDGLAVPALVAQLKAHTNRHAHFGATSQDVIDTSLMIRAKQSFNLIAARLHGLITHLATLSDAYGSNILMARTRMQQALPFTVAHRIATWRDGIADALAAIHACKFPLQFGGPIGILQEFGDKAPALKASIAARLDIETHPQNWHSARAPVIALANASSLVTGVLGKIGVDCALMAQNEFAELIISGGGTSSAMQHKRNPVKAEALVTLARLNATLVSGLHHALVHEQERSGAAWTLEWLLLPQLIVAAGAATRLGDELFQSIAGMGHR